MNDSLLSSNNFSKINELINFYHHHIVTLYLCIQKIQHNINYFSLMQGLVRYVLKSDAQDVHKRTVAMKYVKHMAVTFKSEERRRVCV